MELVEGKQINYRGFDGKITSITSSGVEVVCGAVGPFTFTELINLEDIKMLEQEKLLIEVKYDRRR